MINKEMLSAYIKNNFSKQLPGRSAVLERHFGVRGSQIRDVIRELRREGVPICTIADKHSRLGGYYYSEDPADIEEMKQDLSNRIASMQNTLNQFNKNFGDKPRRLWDVKG